MREAIVSMFIRDGMATSQSPIKILRVLENQTIFLILISYLNV